MKLVLVVTTFALLAAAVSAGFCDGKPGSGYYCDKDVSKLCSCKKKGKSLKCSKSSETNCLLKGTGWRCKYGGRCSAPPPPPAADEICATTSLTTVKDAAALNQCPILKTPYLLWKNFYDTQITRTNGLANAMGDEMWFEDLRLQMINSFNETFNVTTVDDIAMYYPNIAMTWTTTCAADVKEFACRSHMPECKGNKGVTQTCENVCSKIDKCADDFFKKCTDEKTAKGASADFDCLSYVDLYPDFVVTEDGPFKGKRNCPLFCARNQNDYLSGVSSMGPSALLGALLGVVAMFFTQ